MVAAISFHTRRAHRLPVAHCCNYCTDMVFYNRRFNAYEVKRVVNEVTGLVRRHGTSMKWRMSRFELLVDVHRAVGICAGLSRFGASV